VQNFAIQTIKNDIVFDFCFHLKEAIKYNNWFYGKKIYDYRLCENIADIHELDIEFFVPVGSVEFVLSFYKTYYGIDIKPINIPKELNRYEFLKRKVFKGNKKKNILNSLDKKYFIKDISGFKKQTDIVTFEEIPESKDILVSEEIKILNEWRCFVYNNKFLDIRSYNTDYFIYPDVKMIKEMIKKYKKSPRAYTLDVAVTDKKETVLIEVHQFFSCGLYGFMDYRVLPNMFITTHKEIIGNL